MQGGKNAKPRRAVAGEGRVVKPMNRKKIRIAVIENEAMTAGLMEAWIGRHRDVEVAGCAGDGEAGWELCLTAQPDVALVDVQLPKEEGFLLAERLAECFPEIRLLLMAGQIDAYTLWRVTRSRVQGFINKCRPPGLLIEAIRAVARGQTFFGPAFEQAKQKWLSQPESFQKILSEREQQVLRSVAAGWEDDRIGAALGISPATVECHRKRVPQKLGLHNDRDLLAYARQWGLDR
jgi:DNA-binding NarL/FixJ family response regulator